MVQIRGVRLRDLAERMDLENIAALDGFLDREELEVARSWSRVRLEEAGGNYAMVEGPSELRRTVLGTIGEDPSFTSLLFGLYALKAGRAPASPNLYQVLRMLGPNAGPEHSLKFHYDSFVVTALVPIEMPNEGGDLVVARSQRSLRLSYARNVLDKLCVDNAASQAAFRALYRFGAPHVFKRIALKPGTLYLFWGYCVLHTNEACPRGAVRTTALWHFGDPHRESPFKKALGRGI